MRTTFVQCDLCGAEIQGEMAVFLCNDKIMTEDFKTVPIKRESDFCLECSEKVKKAINKIGGEIKVAQEKQSKEEIQS